MDAIVWAALAALAAVAAAIVTVIKFWTNLSDRITKSNSVGENALQEAAEAKSEATSARQSVATLSAALSLFQIQVAKDYVDKDTMREVESRVIGAVKDAARASTEAIAALTRRIDELTKSQHS